MEKRYTQHWDLLLDERGFNAGNGDKLTTFVPRDNSLFGDTHFHTL